METKEKQAAILLTESPIVTLVSIGTDGYPRPVPMMHLKSEGIHKIWFGTRADTEKVVNFKHNPKAGISFHTENGSVVLAGDVSVSSDQALREALWQDWFSTYFPKGKEEFVILEFTTHKLEHWAHEDSRKLYHKK